MKLNKQFWNKRRVLLTGHTGFKGAWTALVLENLGAEVIGISQAPDTNPSLYELLTPWVNLKSIICDIRNRENLKKYIEEIKPEIVIHMAAQPLVRESYHSPVETIETNVMGTVNLLDSLRHISNLQAILVITSDKVYKNNNDAISMLESSTLGGHDPYSASKAATEIVTKSYAESFFSNLNIPVCTARAGNVIGGGDWAKDRIVPDLWKAYISQQAVLLRYPNAIRPWQHVLDPICGYLSYIESMVNNLEITPSALNFGPCIKTKRSVLELSILFSSALKADNLFEIGAQDLQLEECKFLSIDISLAEKSINWRPILNVDDAIQLTGDWYKAFQKNEDMRTFSIKQINHFLNPAKVEVATRKDYSSIATIE